MERAQYEKSWLLRGKILPVFEKFRRMPVPSAGSGWQWLAAARTIKAELGTERKVRDLGSGTSLPSSISAESGGVSRMISERKTRCTR